jgi:tetratricopeptide (TPR) repeat protein
MADLRGAEKNLIHSRKLAAELGKPRLFALADLCLAAVYLEQGRPREAEAAAATAIPLLVREGLFEEKGMALTLHAQSLLAQGKPREALQDLRQARPLTNETSHNVFLRMARIYTEAGQWEDARKILAKLSGKMDRMFELEARLAWKILDLQAGAPVCSDLAALEGEARAHHLLLLAHRAAAARAECEKRYLPLQ